MVVARVIAVLLGIALLAGCAPDADQVAPLAKADGWRDGLGPMLPPFGILEIAYDRDTAEQAWRENVPDELPRRDGDPAAPGLYGDIDDVDLDTQVIAVWSSGQSSSCPGWLADVAVDDAGQVHLERDDTAAPGEPCTDDYNPYRMVLAVDRDRVPDPDALPTEEVEGVPEGPGALVTAYPAAG